MAVNYIWNNCCLQSMNNIEEVLRRLFKLLNRYFPQQEGLFEFLTSAMVKKFCPVDEVIHRPGDVINNAYYVGDGLLILYVKERRRKILINIYRKDDIVAIPGFHDQTPSEFYLEVISGTMLACISRKNMEQVYRTFAKANDLSRSILERTEAKIYKHQVELNRKGIVRVERFYKRFPELLNAGKILTDAEVASYLKMTKGTLSTLRRQLFGKKG